MGLFTVAGDKLSVDVYTTDVTPTGPSGESYTVTVTPLPTTVCVSATNDLTYTVNIVNKCETAFFTIDGSNAVLQPIGTPSATHIIQDTAATLQVDTAINVVSSITWTDPCGVIN